MPCTTVATSQQITMVKESFAIIAADPDGATMALFDSLFRHDSSLRYLFPDDLSDHRHRLISMIAFLVRRLDRWERVEPHLRNLGHRHVTYGARPEHFKTFHLALTDVLVERLQVTQDSPTMLAWSAFFQDVETAMDLGRQYGSEDYVQTLQVNPYSPAT